MCTSKLPHICAASPGRRESVGAILEMHRGHGPGFDALRVYLAIGVLTWHSIGVCYGSAATLRTWNSLFGRPFITLLPMFFALSGFLVMGSALRLSSLRHFLANRFLRIFPALATEITLSALVLGPLVTNLPLVDYFSSPVLFTYFGSLVGRVQFVLPGVFLNNPLPGVVNGNLWTIPPEILCYLFMAAMIAMALFKQRAPVTLCAATVFSLNLLQDHVEGWALPDGLLPTRYLVLCFAFGTTLYMWRDVLPYKWSLFALSLAIGGLFLRTPGLIHVSLFALSYCTAFLGVTRLPKGKMFARGDYSYGIYLFGAPIQQTLAALVPASHRIYWNVPLSLSLSIGMAALSWHLVEKRALALRAYVPSSDGILRRSFAMRFVVLAAVFAYALALVRISNIGFAGNLSVVKVAGAATVIVLFAAAGAVVPMLWTLKRPVPMAALVISCAASLAAGAIADRAIMHMRSPGTKVTNMAGVARAIAAFTEYQRTFPRQAGTVMFGDSLTEFADWQSVLDNQDVLNRGIGGDTTAHALSRIDTILAAKPKRVFIMLGINDLRDGVSVLEIVANYRAIVRAITAAGAQVIVQSTLPMAADPNELTPDAAAINRDVATLNEELGLMCRNEGCRFLDLRNTLSPNGVLPPDFTFDGLHLSAAGYRAWSTLLVPIITAH